MGSDQQFRRFIDWKKLGVSPLGEGLLGKKAHARAWRQWEKAKRQALARCEREGRAVPFL